MPQETAERSNGLKPVFVPGAVRENPYLQLLSDALERTGLRVGGLKAVPPGMPLRRCATFAIRKRMIRQADVLHFHWPDAMVRDHTIRRMNLRATLLIAQIRLLRMLGVRIVWTAHNLLPHDLDERHPKSRVCRFIARHSHAVIAHCESVVSQVADFAGMPDTKNIHVIPHGSYIGVYPNEIDGGTARQMLNIPADGRVALMLGRVQPYKGILRLIEVFRSLNDAETCLVIAGRCDSQQDMQAVQNAAAGATNVHLHLRFIDDDKIQLYMNAADVIVLPYANILTSGSAVLAMSYGKAIVAPHTGCLPDTLSSQPELLYHADQDDALARMLAHALENREILQRAGARNMQRAEQWDWDTIGVRTRGVYETVCRQS